jgi:Lipocalin-like domain
MRTMKQIAAPGEVRNEEARVRALNPSLQRGNAGCFMARAFLLVVVASFCLPLQLSAQTDQTNSVQKAFVGTWKLVSYVGEDVSSGAKSDVMGAHPSGYINYGSDGRMIVLIVGTDRKKPAGTVATPAEAESLIRSMLAYAGTYTIDTAKKTVTHHIEISWDQSRAGTDAVRIYKFEGDRLILTTEPSADPATGKKTVRTVVWERVKRD